MKTKAFHECAPNWEQQETEQERDRDFLGRCEVTVRHAFVWGADRFGKWCALHLFIFSLFNNARSCYFECPDDSE
jgi:hypothetical protein